MKSIIWDKVYSSFWWQIELNPTHHLNKGAYGFRGYCKAEGQTEPKDKDQLLKTKLVMLFTQGYIDRCLSIIVHQRKGAFINLAEDTPIIHLTPHNAILYPAYKGNNSEIQKLISDIYQKAMKGVQVDLILRKPKYETKLINNSKDDKLDVNKIKLYSIDALSNYCTRLLTEGFPREAVNSFMQKSLDRNPNML